MDRIGDVLFKGHRQIILEDNGIYYPVNPIEYLATLYEYQIAGKLDENNYIVCDNLREAKETAIMLSDSNYYFLDLKMEHEEYLKIINEKDYSLNLFDIEETVTTIGSIENRTEIPLWIVKEKSSEQPPI